MGVLVKQCKAMGATGLAAILQRVTFPNFVNWRWCSLSISCEEFPDVRTKPNSLENEGT